MAVVSLSWDNHPIPWSVEDVICAKLVRRGQYGYLTPRKLQNLEKRLHSLPGVSASVSLDQVLSLRKLLLAEKAIDRTRKLFQRHEKIRLLKLNVEGASILSVAERFDYPPLQVYKALRVKTQGLPKGVRVCESV